MLCSLFLPCWALHTLFYLPVMPFTTFPVWKILSHCSQLSSTLTSTVNSSLTNLSPNLSSLPFIQNKTKQKPSLVQEEILSSLSLFFFFWKYWTQGLVFYHLSLTCPFAFLVCFSDRVLPWPASNLNPSPLPPEKQDYKYEPPHVAH
jgi:hypothetical protein